MILADTMSNEDLEAVQEPEDMPLSEMNTTLRSLSANVKSIEESVSSIKESVSSMRWFVGIGIAMIGFIVAIK